MRDIKFRGVDIKTGKMVFGGGIDSQRDTPIIINHGERYFVDANTVGQLTGLKDKNGVEIYEGDIVRSRMARKVNGVVELRNGCYFVKGSTDYSRFDIKSDDDCGMDLLYSGRYEVIGNIHQNPELLGD